MFLTESGKVVLREFLRLKLKLIPEDMEGAWTYEDGFADGFAFYLLNTSQEIIDGQKVFPMLMPIIHKEVQDEVILLREVLKREE